MPQLGWLSRNARVAAANSRDVIGHEPHVDRPVDIGGPAVPLQVNGDDLVALG